MAETTPAAAKAAPAAPKAAPAAPKAAPKAPKAAPAAPKAAPAAPISFEDWAGIVEDLNSKRRSGKAFAAALEDLRDTLQKKGKLTKEAAALCVNALRRVSLNEKGFLQYAPQCYPWPVEAKPAPAEKKD